jgi:hypothetical protein
MTSQQVKEGYATVLYLERVAAWFTTFTALSAAVQRQDLAQALALVASSNYVSFQ